jgi:hypothetical protein
MEKRPMSTRKILLALACILGIGQNSSAEPKPIAANQFEELQKLIKPQSGESQFLDIPWILSVWEAREKAAAEGKPILVWSGAGGSPVAVC